MGKHTPGPYRVVTGCETAILAGTEHAPIAIAEIFNVVEGRPFPNSYSPITTANANLFAAAPDLLEALYEALPFINDDLGAYKKGYVAGVEKRAKAAIAKAEGRGE